MISDLRHHKWIHFILLFIGILCISWSAIFVKLSEVSGLTTAFYRMLIGTIGVVPLWWWFRKPGQNKRGVYIAILCGIFFAIDIALWNTSIVLSKASVSTLLANLAPVWVGFGALLFWKQKPKAIFWFGTIIALIGVAIIIGIDHLSTAQLSVGNLLAIFASLFYGAYILTVQHGRATIDTITFTTVSMVSSTIVLFVICIIFETPLSGFEPHSWVALFGLGLISQLGGWLSINYALKFVNPTTASVCLLSQSVFTALFSVPVLGEMLEWYEVSGAGIVLLGIYLVNRK